MHRHSGRKLLLHGIHGRWVFPVLHLLIHHIDRFPGWWVHSQFCIHYIAWKGSMNDEGIKHVTLSKGSAIGGFKIEVYTRSQPGTHLSSILLGVCWSCRPPHYGNKTVWQDDETTRVLLTSHNAGTSFYDVDCVRVPYLHFLSHGIPWFFQNFRSFSRYIWIIFLKWPPLTTQCVYEQKALLKKSWQRS